MSRHVLFVAMLLLASCMPPPPPPAPLEQVDMQVEAMNYRSDEELRSPAGDIVLPLPEGWTVLPSAQRLAEGTIGVALDSLGTMAAILQRVPPSDAIVAALSQRDMRALARACFDRRLQRTGNTVRLSAAFRLSARDSLRFGTYTFTEHNADSSQLSFTYVAVIPTVEGSVYELAVSPLDLALDRRADNRRLDSIFQFLLRIVRVQ
ncbi:MAG: hypothetical protein RML15_05700 [Bacteroidota bacterium]|nr:hypothetical protein [Candidatus Kapabacteria bacterium]MCS7303199.1 hypothetical protein [Candidatus Kapabacteria bacterium]MCX7937516.1 hypothetical protein [Chlorobiota bacterium]MDW8075272.1 hypothetical protein [Bacteroidota bacterium]MDW8271884.1 hypothetical protein [Bacteroidota bacterium]